MPKQFLPKRRQTVNISDLKKMHKERKELQTEAPPEIFSGRGKRRIHYLPYQIKPYSCNQDFGKGLGTKS